MIFQHFPAFWKWEIFVFNFAVARSFSRYSGMTSHNDPNFNAVMKEKYPNNRAIVQTFRGRIENGLAQAPLERIRTHRSYISFVRVPQEDCAKRYAGSFFEFLMGLPCDTPDAHKLLHGYDPSNWDHLLSDTHNHAMLNVLPNFEETVSFETTYRRWNKIFPWSKPSFFFENIQMCEIMCQRSLRNCCRISLVWRLKKFKMRWKESTRGDFQIRLMNFQMIWIRVRWVSPQTRRDWSNENQINFKGERDIKKTRANVWSESYIYHFSTDALPLTEIPPWYD